MATIEKLGKRWRARVRVTGFPAISEMFDTKAQATSWSTEQEADMKARKFQDPRIIADKTLGFLINKYTEEYGTLKPFGKNKKNVLKNLDLALGDVMLPYLTGDRLVEYVKTRLTATEEKAAAGGVTISIDLTYLKTVLKAAKEMWRYPVDLSCIDQARKHLKHNGISTKSKDRTRRPTLLEVDNLITYFRVKKRQVVPMWDLIPFAIGTTMRLGEIVGLRWADLDETDRTIIIRDRKHPTEKKGNDQIVPLLGETFDIIMRQPRNEKEPRIFPYLEGTVSSIFPRACAKLKIDDLGFHDLRHEGISRLFEQGYQIPQVALVSGHKDWKMLARYTQIRAKDLHRVPAPASGGAVAGKPRQST